MMEFTYNGVVRQGFGFYNPNHAAAMVCAVFPFLWAAWFRWRGWRIRIPLALATLLLLAALAATFSRTGLIVLAGQAALYALLRKGSGKALLAVACAAVIMTLAFGAAARFVIDASFLNRFTIWKAGAQLFAANPWTGVGLGNSGLLANAFLLPEGINVGTMINSHLTLLAEFGAAVGFLWFFVLALALRRARCFPAAGVSLAGLCVSSFMASIFDWHVLFDFAGQGGLGMLNFALSWMSFVFFAGLVVFLVAAGLRNDFRAPFHKGAKGAARAAAVGAFIVLVLFLGFRGAAPRVRDGFVLPRDPTQDAALALCDEDWPLRRVRLMFPEKNLLLPLRPWRGEAPETSATSVMLFGDCASYASEYPDAAVTLIAPPGHTRLSGNVVLLRLRASEDAGGLREQARGRGVLIEHF